MELKKIRKASLWEKVLIVLLVTVNVCFLVYWVVLSWNYRMHYDDVFFSWYLRDNSTWQYISEFYMTRSGRFVGYGINAIVFKSANWIGNYNWWPIVFYGLGIAITWSTLKMIKVNITKLTYFVGIVLLYNIFMLTVVDFAVFTWLCAMSYYIMAPAMCLFIRYLNQYDVKWWQWLICGLLTILLGGVGEAFTPMVLLVLFCEGIYIWCLNGWNLKDTWADYRVRRIVYAAIVLFILWIIVLAAPGNYIRLGEADGTDPEGFRTPTGFFDLCRSIVLHVVTFCYFQAFYVPYYLVLFLLALVVGTRMEYTSTVAKWKWIIGMIGAYLAYVTIACIPLAFLYAENFGAQRNYTHMVFLLVVLFAAIGFLLGMGNQKYQKVLKWLSSMGVACMIIVVCLNYIQDVPVAKEYAKAHDERKAYLLELQAQGNKEIVKVPKYPSTATPDIKHNVFKLIGKNTPMQSIYYEADTNIIPNEYESHVKKWLILSFDFVLDE